MSNYENASLVLSTYNGATSNNGASCTWSNINMRVLLGPLYDKYDCFNLTLNTIVSGVTAAGLGTSTFGTSASGEGDRNLLIKVSGIPFINNSYVVGSTYNVNQSAAILGSFYMARSQVNTQYFYSSNIAMFGKNQDIANLTIDLVRLDFSTPISAGVPYPNFVYIFDIFGIPKDDPQAKADKHIFKLGFNK